MSIIPQNKENIKGKSCEVEQEGWNFFKVQDWIIEDERLTKCDILTYTALCKFADVNSGACWPSQEKLAKYARYSRKKVNQSLKRLAEIGYISKTDRGRQTIIEGGRKKVVNKSLKYIVKNVAYLTKFNKLINKKLDNKKITQQQYDQLNKLLDKKPIPQETLLYQRLAQSVATTQGQSVVTTQELELKGLELEPIKPKHKMSGDGCLNNFNDTDKTFSNISIDDYIEVKEELEWDLNLNFNKEQLNEIETLLNIVKAKHVEKGKPCNIDLAKKWVIEASNKVSYMAKKGNISRENLMGYIKQVLRHQIEVKDSVGEFIQQFELHKMIQRGKKATNKVAEF